MVLTVKRVQNYATAGLVLSKVLQVLSPTTVQLELPSTSRVNPVFNVSVLKPYEVPVDEPDDELSEEPAVMEDLPPSPIIDQDGHERFIVEGFEAQVCSEQDSLFG